MSLLLSEIGEELKVEVLILRFTFQRPSCNFLSFPPTLLSVWSSILKSLFFFRFPVFVSMVTEVKLQDGTDGSYTK